MFSASVLPGLQSDILVGDEAEMNEESRKMAGRTIMHTAVQEFIIVDNFLGNNADLLFDPAGTQLPAVFNCQ